MCNTVFFSLFRQIYEIPFITSQELNELLTLNYSKLWSFSHN